MNFDWLRTKTFEHTLRGALYYWTFCFGYSSYETFINLYFTQIGFSSLQIGMLAAAVCTMSFFAAPFLSNLADHFNQRKLFLGGSLVFMSIVLILLGFPTTFLPIFILYTLTALFRAPTTPLADSLATQMEKHAHSSFTTMRAIGSLGGGMAAIGFGYLWSLAGLNTMFIVGGFLLLLAALSTQLFVEYPPLKRNQAGLKAKELLQNRTLLYVWASSIPVWTALFMSWTFEGVYAQNLGANSSLVGLIRGLAILVEVPAMLLSGRMMKKGNSIEILYGAFILLAATHFLYALIPRSEWLPFIGILKGIGVGFLIPGLVRAVSDQSPPEFASSYQGFTSALTWGLSALIGSLLGGLLYDTLGGRTMFAICAMLTAAAVLVLFSFLNRHGHTIEASAVTLEHIPPPALIAMPSDDLPVPAVKNSGRKSPGASRDEQEEVIISTLQRRYSRMLDKD